MSESPIAQERAMIEAAIEQIREAREGIDGYGAWPEADRLHDLVDQFAKDVAAVLDSAENPEPSPATKNTVANDGTVWVLVTDNGFELEVFSQCPTFADDLTESGTVDLPRVLYVANIDGGDSKVIATSDEGRIRG